MVDQIDFKDITVEEVPATSAVLMGAAHHLDLTSHLENTGVGISGCPVSLDNKKTELGSSSHNEVSPSSGEDIGIVLVPCRTWKCIPPAIFGSYCKEDFTTFVQKRFQTKDPRATIEEGKAVTRCALDFFKKMKNHCNKEFTDHWTCLDYNNQSYGFCRKTQKPYDDCVLKHLNLTTNQPVHITGPM